MKKLYLFLKITHVWNFPAGKNPPCNAGDVGSIPGNETKIPHAVEQLSPLATTRESVSHNERSCVTQQRPHLPQVRPDTAKEIFKTKQNKTQLHMFNKKIWKTQKS